MVFYSYCWGIFTAYFRPYAVFGQYLAFLLIITCYAIFHFYTYNKNFFKNLHIFKVGAVLIGSIIATFGYYDTSLNNFEFALGNGDDLFFRNIIWVIFPYCHLISASVFFVFYLKYKDEDDIIHAKFDLAFYILFILVFLHTLISTFKFIRLKKLSKN